MNPSAPVAVIGANGRTGRALCRTLLRAHIPLIACTRSPEQVRKNLAHFPQHAVTVRSLELHDSQNVRDALRDGAFIITTAHARHLPTLLHASKAPIVALGSTRKNTHWPDDHARGVLLGERALQNDPRPSIILHPTMIYGAEGENNVQRLTKLLRFLPVIPLPNHGRALVQPIDQEDVIRCLYAALELLRKRNITGPESITIAGAECLSYRDFITKIMQHAGLKPRPILSLPASFLMRMAQLTAFIPALPAIKPAEIRRLLEDKDANITTMTTRLGVQPISFDEGLKRLFQST